MHYLDFLKKKKHSKQFQKLFSDILEIHHFILQ